MKKVFFFVSLFVFSSVVFGQNMARVKSVIDTLSSPAYHGRGYVEKGDFKAANFIAREFSRIGLEKINQSYFQKFSFPINTFPGELSLTIDQKALEAGRDFIMEASSASGSFKGNLCFLDTLIFSDLSAREKFLKAKCNKDVLVYREEDFPKIMKLEKKYLKKFHCYKAHIKTQNKLTASVSTQQFPVVTFQVLSSSIPSDARKINYKVEAKLIENYASQNVLGLIQGNNQKDSLIVITAHYDHLGRMGAKTYFPGANDNASGISMLLELADYYKSNPTLSKYSVLFIAFAGEEAGLLGSKFFVENPLVDLNKIKFLINLDLVGTGDDGIAIVNATFHQKQLKLIEKINNENNYFPLIKKRGEAANSDHYFFHVKGVKSFFIYTLGGIKAYHDIDDRADTLPLTKYSQFYNLMIKFISEL